MDEKCQVRLYTILYYTIYSTYWGNRGESLLFGGTKLAKQRQENPIVNQHWSELNYDNRKMCPMMMMMVRMTPAYVSGLSQPIEWLTDWKLKGETRVTKRVLISFRVVWRFFLWGDNIYDTVAKNGKKDLQFPIYSYVYGQR